MADERIHGMGAVHSGTALTNLVIQQVNNVWVKVICEDGIAQELSDFFCFSVPNARFSPLHKNRIWDGKIRLFSLKTRQIYAGLIPYLVEFAKMNEYSYSIVPFGTPGITGVEPYSTPHEIRDYQLQGFQLALARKRALLISPTASGKSLIIYQIARYLLEHGRKQGLLIVPTTSLVEQMYGDFKDYGWDVSRNCQRVYYDSGEGREPVFPLVISTWQSIAEMPKKYFTKFDFVIGDEAHHFKADSLKRIMTSLVNCDYRIGTTGTLDGTKIHKLVLEGLFGATRKLTSTRQLMDRGQIAQLEIKCLNLRYPEEDCKRIRGADYPAELDFLCSHPKRNNFIANLVKKLDGNTLVLYTYVDKHGRILYDLIREKLPPERKVHFVFGGTDVEMREEIRRITEEETDSVIVASYGTFSTGVNIRNLHNAVLASPTKSQIRTLQSIGRSLRLGDRKTKATIYDVSDDMRYGTYVNHTLNHYAERVKIYHAEKFDIKTFNIGI